MAALGQFDIVYCWGVLHCTGRLWTGLENVSKLGKPEQSRLWISIYSKGPNYLKDLKQKQRFNDAIWVYRQAILLRYLLGRWRHERSKGRRVPEWFWHGRGMNAYHDAIDWLGGLPYEVASIEEVTASVEAQGWQLERVKRANEGGCNVYLFHR